MDSNQINLSKLGTFTSEQGAEIVAHDPTTQRLFITTGDTIEIIDISNPANPTKVSEIDITSIGGGANSVAVKNGIVAVAVEGNSKQDNGKVAFYNTNGELQSSVTVGALPDMLTFTPDGKKVIVANEGEPNDAYDNDPEGSISIIDISGGVAILTDANVTTAGFTGFNNQKQALIDKGVRIFGPNATVAQDLEPEYIAVSPDGSTAFVTLQENNAVAIVDIANGTVQDVLSLGEKDHSQEGNKLDASNKDDKIDIKNHPVFGLYQPDAIDSFEVDGKTYYITANEGDARDYDAFSEEARVKDLTLDPTVFPDAATLQQDENLGRLKTTTTLGDTDGDGDVDKIYSYGARSFSVWDDQGQLVFDSGDQIAQITAEKTPELFNANDGIAEEFDERSDDKGAEPESVTVGIIDGKPYGFIGLERAGGGVLVYDLSDPTAPKFNQYIRTEGDIAPEGLQFIAAEDSSNGKPMLVVTNEESNTTTLYDVKPNYTLQILHTSDLEGGQDVIEDAPNFAAIVDRLEEDYSNTITLSAGDNYLPGAFFDAADNQLLAPTLQEVYEKLYNLPKGSLSGLESSSGRIDNAIMNIIGFDASALGNHEFDLGTEKIADIIDADINGANLSDAKWLGAQFPYLSANLDFSGDSNLAPLFTSDITTNTEFFPLDNPETLTAADLPDLDAAPKIAPATILEEGGEKIGVVGAITQLLASISTPGDTKVKGVGTDDMQALADILNPVVKQVQDQGVNKIVLVSHLQDINLEQELVPLLNGVDVVVAGGSDTRLADDTDRLREGDEAQGDYPLTKDKNGNPLTNADGDPAVIISTDGQYSYVGRLVVEFDADGKLITESIDSDISGAYATDDQGVEDLWGKADPFAQGSKGQLVKQLTDEVEEVALKVADGNVLGFTDVFLQGERDPGVRTEETNLGNLTADANLAIAKEFDSTVMVSIKNGGGIRASIGDKETQSPPPANPDASPAQPEGGISQLDVQTTLAFNNKLTLMTVTAKELEQILEHAVAQAPTAKGQFPQVSGLSFSFDDDNQAIEFGQDANGNTVVTTDGERIQSLAIVDEDGNIIDTIAQNGEIVGDPNREIRLVTLNFLANLRDNGLGGDNYPFPIFGENVVELSEVLTASGDATFADPGTEQDALAEYLLDNFSTEAEAFNSADTSVENDTRIQNLDFRDDTVLAVKEVESTKVNGFSIESLNLSNFAPGQEVTVNYEISREADFDNEVYFYKVDDITGKIGDVEVGESGYLQAALENIRNQEAFKTFDDANNEQGSLKITAGDMVVPLIVADGTLAEALSGDAEVYLPYSGANGSDTFDHIKLLDDGSFGFEDLPNGGDQDFNDIKIKINSIA